MKKILLMLAAFGVLGTGATAVQADPKSDLAKFQAYFRAKFPTVKFDDYTHGLYTLPGMQVYKAQWTAINEFPPYELGLSKGEEMWKKPFANGKTFASCFPNGGVKIAQHYPKWDKAKKEVRSAEMDLIDCMKANEPSMAEKFKDLDKDGKARVSMANLTAYLYSLSKGERVAPAVDFSDPGARKAYEEGKKFFWAKRGQLNFACGDCHGANAGKNLGGNQPLSAALGHTTGWPAFRPVWGRLETIHQRYKTCNKQVRAKPGKHFSKPYLNLQLYETYMSSGLPLSAPAMRN
ncbi:MAG: sulfur oxidation c-type cytochrome SoxA [Candidatus Muproteobacteria bacterium RBG_16_62_13]|uniref:SoxAX cytochrome complex subunit A n=1 Tax=Candidatus Muproteobacteria bacterium RBG_16_62_13 TaxID=1817756 RepID=A0A1F6T8Z3_9PROT|nr:MAG: sulfur oxidation c-type cytochrome SoxA [Candidatus Muproteobacteria bacterium RBG_16_62_13]